MEIQEKETKERLRSTLPYGSNAEIRRKVLEMYGKTVSASHIGNVLDPSKEAWDNDIISVALDLAAVNVAKRQGIAKKLANL